MFERSWIAASRTHRGNKRRCNEDSVMACSKASMWAVADGMGGHSAGDLASQLIADALFPEFEKVPASDSLNDRVDWIEDRLTSVDQELQEHARKMGPGTVIGSTVVSLTIKGPTGVVLWAGDSRLYRLREGELTLVTRDHNPIMELHERGAISAEEALETDTHVITRAVGGQRPLELDVAVFDVQPTDTLLLCTDGLYREVSESELVSILGQFDLESAATELVELALSRPARDNLSLLAVRGTDHASH